MEIIEIEISFEEYIALIREIKIRLGFRSFDHNSEPEFGPDLGYKSGNESDIKTWNKSHNINDTSTNLASRENSNFDAKSNEVIDVWISNFFLTILRKLFL